MVHGEVVGDQARARPDQGSLGRFVGQERIPLGVGGVDVLAAVAAKQDALTASSNLQLNYLNADGLDVKALAASDQGLSVISGN